MTPTHSKIIPQEEISIQEIEEQSSLPDETGELAVDIYKTERSITLIAAVAGCAKEDLNIRINENVLLISGKRYAPPMAGGSFIVQECFWGPFSRMIVLPSKVDISHVHATFKNGILTITIPVIFEPKEKIISIE